VREFSQVASNWRSSESAQLYLNRHKIPAIWDIDTRALVLHIRKVGALRGMVSTDGTAADQLVFEAKQLPLMAGQELASRVSCEKAYDWQKGSIELATSPWAEQMGESGVSPENHRFKVVAYDFGIKQNILRLLVDHQCAVKVVPASTSAEDVLSLGPDGVFLSNGPGDPEPVGYAHENIRKMAGRVPILPGAPVVRAGAGWKDLQAEVWAPRVESSGEEFADESSRDYRSESWVLRRPGVVAVG
jgi:carbamoyl-phosphate synthase small subunit